MLPRFPDLPLLRRGDIAEYGIEVFRFSNPECGPVFHAKARFPAKRLFLLPEPEAEVRAKHGTGRNPGEELAKIALPFQPGAGMLREARAGVHREKQHAPYLGQRPESRAFPGFFYPENFPFGANRFPPPVLQEKGIGIGKRKPFPSFL